MEPPVSAMRRPVPVLFIGAPTTGKSALLAHIEHDSGSAAQNFKERYLPTDKSHFVIHMVNATTSLQIWEVTGRVGVSRSILSKARCVVLFVDLSNPATLDDLDTVYERFKLGAGLDHDSWPCVVCGTKLDLCFGGGSAVLSESDLHRWSARRRPFAEVDSFSPTSSGSSRIKVYIVSSRTGAGVSGMISYLASLVESDTSLASRTPTKNDDSTGGSVYGGSQLSYSSYEGTASPLSLSSSPLPAAVWPFSDLVARTPQTKHAQSQKASPSSATSDPLDSLSEVSEATSSQVSGMSSSLYSSQTSPESDISGSVTGLRNMNKVVVIGGAGVGKTGILQKYSAPQKNATQGFPYEPTVGADCREMLVNGVPMQVWDTSGNPKMIPLGRSLYKHARGAILVFDVSSRKSFEEIQVYFDNFRKHAKCQQSPIVLVGNKTDLRRKDSDYVRADESYSWLSKHSLPGSCYLETSILEPASITAVFDLLSRSFEDDRAGSHSHSHSHTPVATVDHRMSPAQGQNTVRASPLPRIDSASRIESVGGGGTQLKKARETQRQRQQQQQQHSLLPEISRHQEAGFSSPLRSPSQPNEEKTCDVFAVFSFW